MKIRASVDIDLSEMAEAVYQGCSDEELISFILVLMTEFVMYSFLNN